jgi:GNAT superfamily N-acetyltransferase
MEVTILPASTDDIPDLLRVHECAFKSDHFSNFMLADRDGNVHHNLMKRSIETWLSSYTSQLVKAMANDGNIIGWVCWLVKEEEKSEPFIKPKDIIEKLNNIAVFHAEKVPTDEPGESINHTSQLQNDKLKTPAQLISRQMRNDLMKWENQMKGKRYYVLQALVTIAHYQCQGVGSKIIQWGVDRADAEKIPCWIHASPAGSRLYTRAGFQELGNNEYDIGDWGEYTFRYMLRPAKE